MKPFDDDGHELDAIFRIEPLDDGGVYLVLESRGGGEGGPRPPRNADYAPALDLLLRRLGQRDATLRNVEVFSNVTSKWPAAERKIAAASFPLPVKLGAVSDFTRLRHELGRESAALGRPPGKTGGNPTKKLRLLLDWEDADHTELGVPIEAKLEAILAAVPPIPKGPPGPKSSRYDPLGDYLRRQTGAEVRLRLSEIAAITGAEFPREAWTPQFWANVAGYHNSRRRQWLDAGYEAFFERRSETVMFRRKALAETADEMPTADPDELRERARAAKSKLERSGGGNGRPPPGATNVEKTSATVTRYVRDPKVVAWVLFLAAGHCEACDEPAPFVDADGVPFLEVHHVRPLGEGGPDQTDNAVAACPNCHRRLHFGRDRDAVRQAVLAKVQRLTDYPLAPSVTTAKATIASELADA